MGLRLDKPWIELSPEAIAEVSAQLGVYQVADADDRILVIGYAGGREPFGMRTALERELDRPGATRFRYELTHGYQTRWEELLMVHHADHGELPEGNADRLQPLGRLTVDPAGDPASTRQERA